MANYEIALPPTPRPPQKAIGGYCNITTLGDTKDSQSLGPTDIARHRMKERVAYICMEKLERSHAGSEKEVRVVPSLFITYAYRMVKLLLASLSKYRSIFSGAPAARRGAERSPIPI